jgi:RimJ/RimL family protein N-acetyltransferase
MGLPDTFCTERLRAERLRPEHLDELCRMHRDAQVMATLGGLRSDEQTRRFLQESLDHWERHGFGLWVFRDRGDGRFAGRGGLRKIAVDGRDEVEVAYALMTDFWGKGLATEMAAATVRVAFEQLGLAEVVAFTLPTNWASRRVMEKVGFQYERDIVHAGLPHVLYRLRSFVKHGSPGEVNQLS